MLTSKIVTGCPIVVYGTFTGGVYEKDHYTSQPQKRRQDRYFQRMVMTRMLRQKTVREEVHLEFNYLCRALPNVSIVLHSHNVSKVIVVHCISRKWRKENIMLRPNLNFNTKSCTTDNRLFPSSYLLSI